MGEPTIILMLNGTDRLCQDQAHPCGREEGHAYSPNVLYVVLRQFKYPDVRPVESLLANQ